MTIGGINVPHFTALKISYSMSGIGTSGVVSATLEFKTYSDLEIGDDLLAYGAEVNLSCGDEINYPIPAFYVKTKNTDDGFTNWVCADRMSKADTLIEFAESDFTDDKISADTVLSRAAHAAGFLSISYVSDAALSYVSIVGNIRRSIVEGKSARDILDMFAEAFCGYWTDGGNSIVFVPFGNARNYVAGIKYTPLKYGGKKAYTKLIMYSGDAVYSAGIGSAKNTLMISTPLASQELCNAVYGQIFGIKYQAWTCEKGFAKNYIYIGGINFGENSMLCTNVTMYPTRSGVFFSASANNISETDYSYKSQVQRQLNRKIELDTRCGNTAYGKNGVSIFQNLNSGAEDERTETTVMTFFESEV